MVMFEVASLFSGRRKRRPKARGHVGNIKRVHVDEKIETAVALMFSEVGRLRDLPPVSFVYLPSVVYPAGMVYTMRYSDMRTYDNVYSARKSRKRVTPAMMSRILRITL